MCRGEVTLVVPGEAPPRAIRAWVRLARALAPTDPANEGLWTEHPLARAVALGDLLARDAGAWRATVLRAFVAAGGDASGAALHLGVSRAQLGAWALEEPAVGRLLAQSCERDYQRYRRDRGNPVECLRHHWCGAGPVPSHLFRGGRLRALAALGADA